MGVERTCRFYSEVFGMRAVTFGGGRRALVFGEQKIDPHEAGREFEPKAACPTPGSADLCLISRTLLEAGISHLGERVVEVLEGPVSRTGALGEVGSVYVRDPDGDLVEVSNYRAAPAGPGG